MIVSKHAYLRLGTLLACAAAAAIAAPIAQSGSAQASKYGPLDPWALKLLNGGRSSIPLLTEHSQGQNEPARRSRVASADAKYGPPDPWALNLLNGSRSPTPLLTEHSQGQNRSATGVNVGQARIRITDSGGFRWNDAGVGAGTAIGFMLVASGAALGVRRNRARRVHV